MTANHTSTVYFFRVCVGGGLSQFIRCLNNLGTLSDGVGCGKSDFFPPSPISLEGRHRPPIVNVNPVQYCFYIGVGSLTGQKSVQILQIVMCPPSQWQTQANLFEGDDADQTAHAGHVGMIQTQKGEDGVGLRGVQDTRMMVDNVANWFLHKVGCLHLMKRGLLH